MSSIIPPVQAPAGAPNVTATIDLANEDYVVDAGTTKYSQGLLWLLQNYGFGPNIALINHGTLWAAGDSARTVNAMNLGRIQNTGLIAAQATAGEAHAIKISSYSLGIDNSGAIYALAHGGIALAWEDWGSNNITNSGTIAAQSDQYASAVARHNGGQVVNQAGGSILAEGSHATAITLDRGHVDPTGNPAYADVINAGLIEAASTDPTIASVAIYASHLEVERLDIVNSGTIRGDYAVYVNSFAFTPPQFATETITNLAGGVIDGDIFLDLGDDKIVNSGTMSGYIDMGENNDLFDNSAGTLIGVADMGWGQDRFLGGAGSDVAGGDRGADQLFGGAGNDLLVGGRGDDVLQGDTGNDGLYGDYGNDRIVTLGGDRAVGGGGDDRIELGDYSFTAVDGGAGQDVLALPGGARLLDLQAALATGRIAGIEELQLGGGKELIVRAGDVAALSGGTSVRIGGTGSDKVDLVGGWTAGALQTIGGVTYQSYSQGGTQVLVAQGVTVAVMADAPAGGVGLDAVAAGDAPLAPGGSTGLGLSGSLTQASLFALTSDLTIDADEHWFSTDGYTMFFSDSTGYPKALVNYGTITDDAGANGARAVGDIAVENHGEIEVSVVSGSDKLAENKSYIATYGLLTAMTKLYGNATALGNGGSNTGLISAQADQWIATGSVAGSMHNEGTISATSSLLIAVGVFALETRAQVFNSGLIEATGATEAYAVGLNGGILENSGTIQAHTTGTGAGAYGLWVGGDGTRIYNSGTIDAATAILTTYTASGGGTFIYNSGQISGLIRCDVNPTGGLPADDVVINKGTITGNVMLGGGRDYYDGTGGTQNGIVHGEAGNDVLIGTAHADTLYGDDGNDILFGSGGDTLSGGAGSDRYVYAGSVSGSETISDFTSGSDSIDLSALAPTSVTITGSGASTVVTAATGAGTLVIHVNGSVVQSDILLAAPSTNGTANDDVLIAAAAGSSLKGLDGNDLLIGHGGNDMFDGGLGADQMVGGAGDDTYVVDNLGDFVREAPGGGYDTIQIAAGFYLQMPDNVEKLVGGSGVGNGLDNLMIGSTGNDDLDGGSGNDVLAGGKGDDTYTVDTQGDVILENAGEGHDVVNSAISFYLYPNIEDLILTGRDNVFGVGNASDNNIRGNLGDNLLLGGGGNDTIDGAGANDSLFGEAGNDTLIGNDGTDYLAGGDGNDKLLGGYGADAMYGEAGDDTLNGGDGFYTDIMVGGAGNDVLHGDSGQGDYDLMDGGSGNDVYFADTYADLTFEAVGGGTDTVYASVGSSSGYYLYANVENLVLTGTSFYGVGNELDNMMTGNGSANWLLGGAGNDVLDGKAGNDVLFGQGGADTFVFQFDTGGDTIADFTPGTDRIDLSAFGLTSFAQVQAAMVENGGTTAINLGHGDFIVIQNVANAALHAGDFILSGGSAAQVEQLVHAEAADDTGFTASRGDLVHQFDAPHLLVGAGPPELYL